MTPRLIAGIAALLSSVSPTYAVDLERPDVKVFMDTMVQEHDYDRETLQDILRQAEIKQKIVDSISKPAEGTLTWAEYRPIFMTKERI